MSLLTHDAVPVSLWGTLILPGCWVAKKDLPFFTLDNQHSCFTALRQIRKGPPCGGHPSAVIRLRSAVGSRPSSVLRLRVCEIYCNIHDPVLYFTVLTYLNDK